MRDFSFAFSACRYMYVCMFAFVLPSFNAAPPSPSAATPPPPLDPPSDAENWAQHL